MKLQSSFDCIPFALCAHACFHVVLSKQKMMSLHAHVLLTVGVGANSSQLRPPALSRHSKIAVTLMHLTQRTWMTSTPLPLH